MSSSLPSSVRTAISPPVGKIDEICALRDEILSLYESALNASDKINALDVPFSPHIFKPEYDYGRAADKMKRITKEVDSALWRKAIEDCGFGCLMNAKELEDMRNSIAKDCPELTAENMKATLISMMESSADTFHRGVVELFRSLDSEYKSHAGWGIGSRVILTGLYDNGWSFWSGARDKVNDIGRIFMLLDGKNPAGLNWEEQPAGQIERAKRIGASECETPYMRCRFFRNGNIHVWPTRKDLVDQVNEIIAKHMGAVLGHRGAA